MDKAAPKWLVCQPLGDSRGGGLMHWECAGKSDIGKVRQGNEDALFASEERVLVALPEWAVMSLARLQARS